MMLKNNWQYLIVFLISFLLVNLVSASTTDKTFTAIPKGFYDPTRPKIPAEKPVPVIKPVNSPVPTFKGELKLSMIFCEKSQCFAVINGERYKSGDQLLGLTLHSVTENEVKLTGYQYNLNAPLVLKLADTQMFSN